jgi:hypothetical protein
VSKDVSKNVWDPVSELWGPALRTSAVWVLRQRPPTSPQRKKDRRGLDNLLSTREFYPRGTCFLFFFCSQVDYAGQREGWLRGESRAADREADEWLSTLASRIRQFLSTVTNTKRQSSHISSQATDAVNSDRMQDIRGVQASLFSYAVP